MGIFMNKEGFAGRCCYSERRYEVKSRERLRVERQHKVRLSLYTFAVLNILIIVLREIILSCLTPLVEKWNPGFKFQLLALCLETSEFATLAGN